MQLRERGAHTLRLESQEIARLAERLDDRFAEAVIAMGNCTGRVVVTGIGKSAHIGAKITATLNSTGTPALFMHAAEAIHGDLGLIQPGDVILCISKSGNSPEIKALMPLFRSMGNPVIGMVGNLESALAQHATIVLDTTVVREACPLNLAPTTSTAVQLALGDALAVCLMEARGFSSSDFAAYHPGGALGKRLYTTLGDLVRSERAPEVSPDAAIGQVLLSISEGRCGATVVVESGEVVGIITDGDIRRAWQHGLSPGGAATAREVMTPHPKRMDIRDLAVEAFSAMEQAAITGIVVCDAERYVGIVHLHDILREGIF
jgi:arabinose-5-phosphate isomerase